MTPQRLLVGAGVGWLALMALAAVWSATRHGVGLNDYFFIAQDAVVLAAMAAFLLALTREGWLRRLTRRLSGALRQLGLAADSPTVSGAWVVAGACLFVVTVGALGWVWVFDRYPLSMDEFWADFDAKIFARGVLVAPIAEPWRAFASALQPMWRLPVQGDTVWASTYLPVNAAARGLLMRAGRAGLTGPLWAAVGSLAVFGVARHLWPERRDAAVVAVLLLASSSQLVATAMTPYAMSAHFALNMLWLALFLRRDAIGLAGAIVVGFAACGLHQLLFHLLFVAPFVVEAWLRREFRRAAMLTLAYAAIALFWASYWGWLLVWVGAAAPLAHDDGAGWFVRRAVQLLRAVDARAVPLMAENLVRFFAWQNPLLLPLMLAGLGTALRARGPLRPLLLGALLTLGVMAVLLPYQGHGWGYRYLHGHLGSLALVAAGGWVALTSDREPRWRAAPTAFAVSMVVSVLVLLPVHLLQARAFAHPYAAAEAAIRGSAAQIVVVDDAGTPFGEDLVRNDPFLQQGAKVMLLAALSPAQLREICSRGSWELFDARNARASGLPTSPAPRSARREAARLILAEDPACRAKRTDQPSDGRQNMLTSSRLGKAAAIAAPR